MIETSIALALCSLLVYGATQVIAKAAVGSLKATSMVAVNFVVSIPIFVFLFISAILFWGEYLENIGYVVCGLIGASSARGGYYIYMEALERGSVSMVGSVTAAFPAITAALAVAFLGERPGITPSVGIGLVIVGMVLLSFSQGRNAAPSSFSRPALLLSVATLLIWGVGSVFIKLALDGLPLIAYLGLYVFVLPPIAFGYLRHKEASWSILMPKWTVPVIAAVVVAELWQLGYFAETAAVSQGAASVVFPLISAYPIVTIIGARIFLRESLSKTEWMILSLVILGMLLISVG